LHLRSDAEKLGKKKFNQIKDLREYVDSMTGMQQRQALCAAVVDFQCHAARGLFA